MLKRLKQIFQNFQTKTHDPKSLAFRQVLTATNSRGLPRWQQWRQLPRVLSLQETRTLLISFVVIILSLGTIVGRFWYSHLTHIPTVGGEYIEAMVGEPQFINPLYATGSDVDRDLTALVFSGLLRWTPDAGLTNDLAQEVTASEDGKTYTVKLREDAKFHDGVPVLADDVVFTVKAIQDPAYRSPLSVTFRGVQVDAQDEHTVVFTLDAPFAPFRSTLTVGILPEHIWADIQARNAPLAARNLEPIGSGPYRFSSFAKDKTGAILTYTLERNTDYYNDPAYISTLTFKMYGDSASAVQALENHNVDGVASIYPDREAAASQVRGIELLRPLFAREVVLSFNETTQPLFKEKTIRSAFAQAINREAILEAAVNNNGNVIYGPILPGQLGASTGTAYPYDVSAANKSLDDAGYKWSEGSSYRSQKTTETKQETEGEASTIPELSVTLTTVQSPEFVAAAEVIVNELAAVGIKVTINAVDRDAFFKEVVTPRQYEMLLTGTLHGIDPDPYPYWHSSQTKTGGLNLAGYANRKADALLEEARVALSDEERASKYQEFQQILDADIPAVFLYQSSYTYARSTKVQGPTVSNLISPSDRFAYVTQWYVKTKRVYK